MKLNTNPWKVFYKLCGKKRVKGHKTEAAAVWYLENIAKVIDENAYIELKIV